MQAEATKQEGADKPSGQPYRVRLPRFIIDEDIGLGDVIKRTTASVGIQPCGGCAQPLARVLAWRFEVAQAHTFASAVCPAQ